MGIQEISGIVERNTASKVESLGSLSDGTELNNTTGVKTWETDTSGWSALLGSFTRSTNQAFEGSYSAEYDSGSNNDDAFESDDTDSASPSAGRIEGYLRQSGSSTRQGYHVRAADADNMYIVNVADFAGDAELIRVSGGSSTIVQTANASGSFDGTLVDDWLPVRVDFFENGSGEFQAEVYELVNSSWTLQITFTDSNNAHTSGGSMGAGDYSGYAGNSGGPTCWCDNIEALWP